MKYSCLIILVLFFKTASSQLKSQHFKIYDSKAQRICTMEEAIESLSGKDIVFFGEEHNDPTGHLLELEILKMLHLRNGKKQVLSMEMFETDVQIVLDEYLHNLIREKNFLKEARSWANYQDYKPMVEYARVHGLAVIAANAPSRYTNLVSRKGLKGLDSLTKAAKSWLPPMPIDTASGRYYENFLKTMGSHQVPGMQIYQAQNLWDKTMAWSIRTHLKKHQGAKIFQINGRFHSDEQLRAVAQLKKLKPSLKIGNISAFSDSTFKNPDWSKFSHLGDYVILTDPDLKRTY